MKLHNISVTPKMVKKVIMNLDLSKASGPDCIPVVVLKNCEPELSYVLAIDSSISVLRMLWKGLQPKTAAQLVFFLWLVKSLKNL